MEPVRGDLRGNVWIQNAHKRLNAYVRISPADVDHLTEDEVAARIEDAIENAISAQ